MSTPSFVSVVLLVLLSTIVHPTTCLSVAQVQTLTGYINKFITSSTSFPPGGGPVRYPLLPALVRLAFHDCAGTACDGCVNLKIASNKGLQAVVSGLELLYNNSTLGIKTMPISRADFWALAGLVAVNFGATLQQVGVCVCVATRGVWVCPVFATAATAAAMASATASVEALTTQFPHAEPPWRPTHRPLHSIITGAY